MARSVRVAMAMFVAVLGTLASVVVTAAPAHACSCASQPLAAQADAADVIFSARVSDVVLAGDEATGTNTFDVRVRTVWKGTAEYVTQVTSAASGATCGLEGIEAGRDYVFFANGAASPFAATLCGGTAQANPTRLTRMEKVLGEGVRVEVPPPPAPVLTKVENAEPQGLARLAAPGAAVVIVALLGLLIVRRVAKP